MWVAVADHLEVEVVGVPAAAEHGVQLLSGLLPGQQAAHRVRGDSLSRMDGAGVAVTGRGAYIVKRQPDGEVAADVPDREVTAPADVGDGPAVPVFDPVVGPEAESPVVAAGDDHISDARPVSVGQRHLGCRSGVIETMRPGTAVELGNHVPGGGDHDCVEPRRPIRNPSLEPLLGGGGYVADMDTAVIKIEIECLRVAFAEGQRGCRFTRVGEAVQLGEAEGAVGVGDVAEDAAGAHRGELLIITNQPDTRAPVDGEPHGGIEDESVGHTRFIDDHQCRRADRCRPLGQLAMIK
jgi:hypothetical protein